MLLRSLLNAVRRLLARLRSLVGGRRRKRVTEVAAFESPLDDEGLKELGRLAVNFGHVEFLLEYRLGWLAKLNTNPEWSARLIAPLATRKKLDLFKATLDGVENKKAKECLMERGRFSTKRLPRGTTCFMAFGPSTQRANRWGLPLSERRRNETLSSM